MKANGSARKARINEIALNLAEKTRVYNTNLMGEFQHHSSLAKEYGGRAKSLREQIKSLNGKPKLESAKTSIKIREMALADVLGIEKRHREWAIAARLASRRLAKKK